ncbi:MAG: RNA polymerase sigma factor [Acidimicrobiales bacterium]
MQRAQKGDRQALDDLLRAHQRRIFCLCRRLCGNHDDALDATQEALLTIARRLDRFDGRSSFGTWAYRVATNACLDELRRRARRPRPMGADQLAQEALSHADQRHRDDADPVGHGVTTRAELDAALATLPEEFRVAVVLRDLADLDYAQIAEVTGAPLGTVRSRIARGRAQLAKQLAGNGNRGTGAVVQPSTVHPDHAPTAHMSPIAEDPQLS